MASMIPLHLRMPVKITAFLLVLYILILAHTAWMAPPEIVEFLFSEQGAFEFFSPWLWLVLAGLCLVAAPMLWKTRIASSIAAILLAMREWDLHKSLFEVSFIKTNFYRSAEIPLGDKLIGAAIIFVMIVVAIFLVRRFLQFCRTQWTGLTVSGFLVYLTFICAAVSKVLDRLTSQLNELFHIVLAKQTSLMIMSLEESMEMLLPVFLILAIFFFRAEQKHKA